MGLEELYLITEPATFPTKVRAYWKYLVVHRDGVGAAEQLNSYGVQGWELCYADQYSMYFKRPYY